MHPKSTKIDKNRSRKASFFRPSFFRRLFIDFLDFHRFFHSPNPCFDWQAHRILHMRKNAMLRPLHSNFAKFWSIFGTIFNPETFQNELRDPIEKNIDLLYLFFQLFGDFWAPLGALGGAIFSKNGWHRLTGSTFEPNLGPFGPPWDHFGSLDPPKASFLTHFWLILDHFGQGLAKKHYKIFGRLRRPDGCETRGGSY